MNGSIQLGPFVVPTTALILLIAITLGMLVAKRLNRRAEVDIERMLWRYLFVGVVVARLAFVYEFRAGYLASPLDILDIRDGGWSPQAGLLAAWICALLDIQRDRGLRKPLLASLAIATLIWGAGAFGLALGNRDDVRLAAMSLPTFDGTMVSVTDYHGKPAIVNLWATWCPPCQRELPLLQKAQAEHPEVHFVFLNQGESAERVQGFLTAKGYTLRNVLLDPKGQAGARFGNGALPTTLLFDAQGKLVGSHLGELSHGTLEQSFSKLGASLSQRK